MAIQYGKTWKKHMLNLDKQLIVSMFENVARERDTLEARLKEAEAVIESITSFPHYAYGDNEAACSMVALASQLLEKWKGATEQIP